MRCKYRIVCFLIIGGLVGLSSAVSAGKLQLPKDVFSAGDPLNAQDLQNNFDALATEATTTQSGLMSAADKAKLDSLSGSPAPSGLNCQSEFEFIEQGTSTKDYWPSTAKRAELLQYGWICWNRLDTTPITPLTTMIHSNLYTDWVDSSGNVTVKNVCGRITRMEYLTKSFYVWSPNYFYGVVNMDNTTNTTHGVWADNFATSTGPSPNGDYWGIYTCR